MASAKMNKRDKSAVKRVKSAAAKRGYKVTKATVTKTGGKKGQGKASTTYSFRSRKKGRGGGGGGGGG